MTACELCGSDEQLVPTLVEGVELNVCKKCSSFGEIIKKTVKKSPPIKKKKVIIRKPEREIIQVIRTDFAKIIKEKRERLGLKQEEFAKFLSERLSLLHKLESGSYTPSLDLARKLEKQLGIKLVEQKQIEPQEIKKSSETYTIGDIIKIK